MLTKITTRLSFYTLLQRNQIRMQSMLNIYGFPLCLSGIIHPLTLSHEMADHEHRRQGMRKKRSLVRGRESINANQEMWSQNNFARQYFVEVKDEDLNDILYDLPHKLTAKAA